MQLHTYRQAVSSIHWAPEERHRIEALLRQDADSPDFTDATDYTEVFSVRIDHSPPPREKPGRLLTCIIIALLVLGFAYCVWQMLLDPGALSELHLGN